MFYALFDITTRQVTMTVSSTIPLTRDNCVLIPDRIDRSLIGTWSTVSKDGILVVGTKPTVQLTAKQKVEIAIAQLVEELSVKQTAGIYYTPTGATTAILFSTSIQAQAQYNAAFSSVKSGLWTSGSSFITESGAPVTLSNDDVIAMTTKAMAYVKQCYATYETLYNKVIADPTTDITVGWPANT